MVIDSVIARLFGLGRHRLAKDLNFIAATQIKSTVGALGHHVFIANDKITILRISDQVRAMLARRNAVDEHTILGAPALETIGIAVVPAGEVAAVEERHETLGSLFCAHGVPVTGRARISINQAD